MAIFAPVLPEYSPGEQTTLPIGLGVAVVDGGAGTWGAWVEVVAAADVPAVPYYITAVSLNAVTADTGVDIEVGYNDGAGGDFAVAAIGFEVATDAGMLGPIHIPATVAIPGGMAAVARLRTVAGLTYGFKLSMRPA